MTIGFDSAKQIELEKTEEILQEVHFIFIHETPNFVNTKKNVNQKIVFLCMFVLIFIVVKII